jgi:hypothetical protein
MELMTALTIMMKKTVQSLLAQLVVTNATLIIYALTKQSVAMVTHLF